MSMCHTFDEIQCLKLLLGTVDSNFVLVIILGMNSGEMIKKEDLLQVGIVRHQLHSVL